MPTRTNDAPLIVTALLEEESFAILDGLRRSYFPAALNKVPAHISLFHHLPGDAETEILGDLRRITKSRSDFVLPSAGVKFLGQGVAIFYEGAELATMRAELAGHWSTWLTPQDRQPFRPHVTIQNKVAPEQGRALFAALRDAAFPDCRVAGLAVWRYLGGPWERVADCRFPPISSSGSE